MFDVIIERFDLSFKRLELIVDSETRFSNGDDAADVDYNQYANTLSTMIRSCVDLDDLFIVITELDEDKQMLYALEHQQDSLKRLLLCAYNEYSTEALLGRRVKQSSWGAIKHFKKSGSIVSVWGSEEEEEEEEEEEDTDDIPEEVISGFYILLIAYLYSADLRLGLHIRERGHILDYRMHQMCHVNPVTPLAELESHFRPLKRASDGSVIYKPGAKTTKFYEKLPSFRGLGAPSENNCRSRYVARRDPFNVPSSRFLEYTSELFSLGKRGQQGSRVVAYEWDLVGENMDFLGSCPSTKILDTVGIDDDWTESEYDEEEEGNDGADGQNHGEETGGSDKADDEKLEIGGKDGNENN
ncbi:hypothetical protein WAI453_005565 [Rhynchosporium graminicola]